MKQVRFCCCLHLFIYLFLLHYSEPLPSRELHSTDETKCGETLGDLGPVYHLFTTRFCLQVQVKGCDTSKWRFCTAAGRFSYGESPWTPPLEGTSLHRRNNSVERPWGILSLSVSSEITLRKSDRFSYGESPRTPLLEGTSLHRRNKLWRDPGGS